MTEPTATVLYHTTPHLPAPPHTPLGRLLRSPSVVALERTYHLDNRGRPTPLFEVTLWTRDGQGRLNHTPVLDTDNAPSNVANLDADFAHAILEAISAKIGRMVEIADTKMSITEGGYHGGMRVLFTADGWILIDQEAETNTVNFMEWEGAVTDTVATPEERQEATDGVDWTRFCLPMLPTPASAHAALAHADIARGMVAVAHAVHAYAGLAQLNQIDWAVAPAP